MHQQIAYTPALLALPLALVLGCASDAAADPSSAGNAADLEAALARLDAAENARCEALVDCYPEVNESDEDRCSGPTEGGTSGWTAGSLEDQQAERACAEKVFAKEPGALVAFLDCFADLADMFVSCIDEAMCPSDIDPCKETGYPAQRECKLKASEKLKPVFEAECGYWDD